MHISSSNKALNRQLAGRSEMDGGKLFLRYYDTTISLNAKQERFAQSLTQGMNASAAYKAAGYAATKDGAIRANASRLLTNANVKSRIAELQRRATAQDPRDHRKHHSRARRVARNRQAAAKPWGDDHGLDGKSQASWPRCRSR